MKAVCEVAQIIRHYHHTFLARYPQGSWALKTLSALARCRTAAFGGHRSRCSHCGHEHNFYNSCRNRHCPKCQAVKRERWMMAREAELLAVPCFHLVFTLPEALNELAMAFPVKVYNALFHAAWDTVKMLSADPRYLGAKTGMVAVLHTWGQQLWLHPHLHCIVPGGGITRGGKWKECVYRGKYLLPKRAMSSIFRAKFVAALRKSGVDIPRQVGKALFSRHWVVYAKKPFASPETVVEYLGRYTHKIAISNHRLISMSEGKVSFFYKDYRHGGKRCVASLDAAEFLRRFCLHILPRGFVRMRHYGILSSRNKAKELNLAKKELGQESWQPLDISWKDVALQRLHINPDRCPVCKKGKMEMIATLSPERGPPVLSAHPMPNILAS